MTDILYRLFCEFLLYSFSGMYLADTFGEKVKFEIKTNETEADSTDNSSF